MLLCPCGSTKTYLKCCDVFINGIAIPSTPEALMRSRYTAYSQGNIGYIVRTMKGPALKNFDEHAALEWVKRATWIKLEIVRCKTSGSKGSVEFIAHFSFDGTAQRLHEISQFIFEEGCWYYVDGIT